jgi:hypothetical protein
MEGMILHTAKGTSMLKGIDITDRKEPTYNLVVADNHTYFVGKESWLSSDVTPFRPVPMKVPGYYESLSAKKIAANREGRKACGARSERPGCWLVAVRRSRAMSKEFPI